MDGSLRAQGRGERVLGNRRPTRPYLLVRRLEHSLRCGSRLHRSHMPAVAGSVSLLWLAPSAGLDVSFGVALPILSLICLSRQFQGYVWSSLRRGQNAVRAFGLALRFCVSCASCPRPAISSAAPRCAKDLPYPTAFHTSQPPLEACPHVPNADQSLRPPRRPAPARPPLCVSAYACSLASDLGLTLSVPWICALSAALAVTGPAVVLYG